MIIVGRILWGLFLFILALLFVPFGYRVEGAARGEEGQRLCAFVTWLFGLLAIGATWEEGSLLFSLRVFGVLLPLKRGADKPDGPRAEGQEEPLGPEEIRMEANTPEGEGTEKGKAGKEGTAKGKEETTGEKEEEEERAPGESLGGRVRSLGRTRRAFSLLFSSEEGKRALSLLFRQTGKLLFSFRPRRFTGKVAFGFEDPSRTGMLLAGAGVLLPLSGWELSLQPDFSAPKDYVRGEGMAQGRVYLFLLLALVGKVMVNKDFWWLVRWARHVRKGV